MITRRRMLAQVLGGAGTRLLAKAPEQVKLVRVPEEGIQPQAAVVDGRLRLLYYKGDSMAGDLYYTQGALDGTGFAPPMRVNSQDGSAIARGSIRGGQLAIARNGRVHVAWNGSGKAQPRGPINPDSGKPGEPMLYTRLNDAGNAFEPQRNLMLHSFGLDGGGSVAADGNGKVYVAWHGIGEKEAAGKEGEARRRVWVTTSEDDGRSFSAEKRAWAEETGACGCCGMKLFAGSNGDVLGLYRSATENVHRDVYLLESRDGAKSFRGKLLHRWEINACPMSSMDFAANSGRVAAAWETGGQVYWTRVDAPAPVVAAPGDGKNRKHPRVAMNSRGELLMVWTEGTGHRSGGGLAWQRFTAGGQPIGEYRQMAGIPAYSFASVVAADDGAFSVVY